MPELLAQLLDLPVPHAGRWIVWVLYALPLVPVCVALWISSGRGGGGGDPSPRDEGGS